MVAVHILFQVSPILLNEVFEPHWSLFKQGPMVGVQALLWYHDLQAEVELFKLFSLPDLITSRQGLWPPGSWSNCACPRRSPFVTQPPRHTHTEVDFVWIMSSTHNYYDHFGPDFPELMIIMHIHNLRNVHTMHNMQARAGYARAKGRKLIAGKNLWRVFEL